VLNDFKGKVGVNFIALQNVHKKSFTLVEIGIMVIFIWVGEIAAVKVKTGI
jgi:uncharacterized membrane protein YkgB